jgi:hypothetical protein
MKLISLHAPEALGSTASAASHGAAAHGRGHGSPGLFHTLLGHAVSAEAPAKEAHAPHAAHATPSPELLSRAPVQASTGRSTAQALRTGLAPQKAQVPARFLAIDLAAPAATGSNAAAATATAVAAATASTAARTTSGPAASGTAVVAAGAAQGARRGPRFPLTSPRVSAAAAAASRATRAGTSQVHPAALISQRPSGALNPHAAPSQADVNAARALAAQAQLHRPPMQAPGARLQTQHGTATPEAAPRKIRPLHETQAEAGADQARASQAQAAAGGAQAQGALHASRPAPRKRSDDAAQPDAAAAEARAGLHAAAAAAPRVSAAAADAAKVPLARTAASRITTAVAPQPGDADPASAKHGRPAGREQAHETDREREKPQKAAEATTAPAPRHDAPTTAVAPAEPRAAPRLAAAEAPAPAQPSHLPSAPAGQDVQGAVLRNAAHLHVDTGNLGALELHLRVRDGAVHMRVDGDSAHVVEAHAAELSRSLASEGLRLAPLEASSRDGAALQSGADGGRQGQERREHWGEAADARHRAPPAPAAVAKANPSSLSGTVHVKA